MLLSKLLVPLPSVVLLSEMVGLTEVLQQTPLPVTEAPPFEMIFPPLEALAEVIDDAAVVVTEGGVAIIKLADTVAQSISKN